MSLVRHGWASRHELCWPAARVAFLEQGFPVTGFDIETAKLTTLDAGGPYIVRILGSEIRQAPEHGFSATADYAAVARMDAVLICVPTPLNEYHEPDLSYTRKTAEAIAPFLRAGQLVLFESTTCPGTTEDVLIPLLEAGAPDGLRYGLSMTGAVRWSIQATTIAC